jgi:hypothetical protein
VGPIAAGNKCKKPYVRHAVGQVGWQVYILTIWIDPMPTTTMYTLEASNITISNGVSLSGVNQGNGSQLMGQTITLGSNIWKAVDVFDTDANFEDSDNSQTLDGAQSYNGVAHASGLRVEAEYRLTVQDPDGNSYTLIGFNINEAGGGPSYGTVEGLSFVGPIGGFPPVGVPLTVTGTSDGPSRATTPFGSYATPPCFTPGTLIETARGQVAIEALQIGDLVATFDDGMQAIRWIGTTVISARDLRDQARLRPILISKGALGAGMPVRDMLVSPMHSVLGGGPRAALLFGEGEVLVPAAHLVGQAGISCPAPVGDVRYIHIAFDAHQIVCSDGAWSESFLPGAQTLSGFDAQVQVELSELFVDAAPSSARLSLKRHESAVLLAA